MTKSDLPKHFVSFSGKLFISVITLFISLAACFIIYQYHREKEYKRELLHAQLQKYNALIESKLGSIIDTIAMNDYINQQEIEDLRVTVVNMDGDVLYDSYQNDSAHLENHLNRPVFFFKQKTAYEIE